MKLRRAKLLMASGALALGTLGGLTAAASPADASLFPAPIQYHNPSPVYIGSWTGCSNALTVVGLDMTPPGPFDSPWVVLYSNDGTWVADGSASDWGNGEFRWQPPMNPGPGTYYASVYDFYGYHYSGDVTFTC